MITKAMKVFGSSKSTGSIALIIEHDNFNLDDRQNFATNQNYAACVFIEQNDEHIVLSAFLKKDIDVFQGNNLNNPCMIHTKYSNDNILIGGSVTPL